MGKPSVILTSQFTTPTAKSFSNYFKYMIRKEALLEKENQLSKEDNQELKVLLRAIEDYQVETGMTYKSLNNKVDDMSQKEVEARTILNSKDDYAKYIKYMARQYALENKKKITEEEKKELHTVKKSISNIICKETPIIKNGVFSINKEIMTEKDIDEVDTIVKNAQKNGSVFYQDVISFDTDFLIKEGIYNPDTNILDEKKIQYASRNMMDKMLEDEDLKSGYWFASIHMNTEHVHIHYGTVEPNNTRRLVAVKEDGIEYLSPKGKRKQVTIDNMKSTFTNSLVDRTAELSRISELRNTLVQDIKQIYFENRNEKNQARLLENIICVLPDNKKDWQYSSKNITNDTRSSIDALTHTLMRENPNYQEYIKNVEKESSYRKELFGQSKRSDKDYAKNKMEDIQKRLGNSLLKEMKTTYKVKADSVKAAQIPFDKHNTNDSKTYEPRTQLPYNKYQKPIISRKDIYQIKCALNDDYDKYRAEKDYEQMQQKIAMEQQRNRL